MCGIYLTNKTFSEQQVCKKIEKIKFRGPDYTGYKKVDNVSMGHVRLSIIDLDKRSNQPMSYFHYHIVFNGEIYNYLEIKKELISLGHKFTTESDTEVLLHSYEQWGVKVLQKLNGMFAFAIYNENDKTVFCARDRMGIAPFYYSWENGELEICSQIRPMVSKQSEVSEDAISIYLQCGYVPSPYSIIDKIHKLLPGNYLIFDLNNKTKTMVEYWNLQPVEIKNISYFDAKEELHALLIDAVKIRLRSDVPVATFLSGGIDSALVSSITAKISSNTINTFTIGFDNPRYDESKTARQFANIIASNHKETICTVKDMLEMLTQMIYVYDEPFADSSSLPSLLVNSKAKKYATVALSGDGGDESFLGYGYDWIKRFQKIEIIPFEIRKLLSMFPYYYKLLGTLKKETINIILKQKNIDDYILTFFKGLGVNLQDNEFADWSRRYSAYFKLSNNHIQNKEDINIKLWLENDSNVKVDRASKAFAVEVRSPFLDYRIVEYARNLPVNYRYDNGVTKRILRDILKEYIPEEVFNKPKKGFSIPLADWIRCELKEEMLQQLTPDFLNIIPDLDVKKCLTMLDLHINQDKDYSHEIWKLYVLNKWYQEFHNMQNE
jgi:asparagine synthase (glutamine-hydrolysing)